MKKSDLLCICDFETTGITRQDYPIEVACLWTDYDFNHIDEIESLIRWPAFSGLETWLKPWNDAVTFHGIGFDEILNNGN